MHDRIAGYDSYSSCMFHSSAVNSHVAGHSCQFNVSAESKRIDRSCCSRPSFEVGLGNSSSIPCGPMIVGSLAGPSGRHEDPPLNESISCGPMIVGSLAGPSERHEDPPLNESISCLLIHSSDVLLGYSSATEPATITHDSPLNR
jgi:hypothetical protein